MKKLLLFAACLSIAACDLRQHIVDAPANLGDFIAGRIPALLADPSSEIYEFASVLDYGMETDVSLYGFPRSEIITIHDYMLFANLEDYVMPEHRTIRRQTLSTASVEYGGVIMEEQKSFVLDTAEIRVQSGDTAFSIARRHNMPVQRLALLNNLSAPYSLRVGQTLRVENAEIVTTRTEAPQPDMTAMTPGASPAPSVQERPVVRSNAGTRLPALPPRAGNKFMWPVKGRIISDFGPKRTGLNNDGINIAAPLGTKVVAADNGVVAYAGNELKGMGNLLIIQHAGGWMTVYAHLDTFVVRRGDKVNIGQKIGTVGRTGKVDEPQLHFETRRGARAFDPKKELR